jgi:hypothetical protein
MAGTDPFGREKGENPLQGLGSLGGDTTKTTVATSSAGDASKPSSVSLGDALGGRSVIKRFLPAFIVFDLIVAAIIGAVVLFASSDDESKPSKPGIALPSFSASQSRSPATSVPTTSPVVPEKPSTDPSGVNSASLLNPVNLRPALNRVARIGPIHSLRLAPDRIDAQSISKGKIINAQVTAGGGFQVLSVSGPGFAGLETVSVTRIDAAVPARLVRKAAAQLGRSAADFDYMVYLSFAGRPIWSLFFKDGTHFDADGDGGGLKKI